MKVKRLDDASIPTAENTEGLILHGMQNGQTKKVPSELMASQTDLGLKLDKSSVEQTTGTDINKPMSQKGVTDLLSLTNPQFLAKPSVSNVAALTTTYPTAQKGWAAIVSADGYVYWYNGTSWANTGLTAFPKDVALRDELSERVKIRSGVNLLNPDEIIEGKSFDSAFNMQNTPGVSITGKIYFNGNESIFCNCYESSYRSVIYSADDIPIWTGLSSYGLINNVSGGAYVRYSIVSSFENKMANHGTLPQPYSKFNPITGYVRDEFDKIDILEKEITTKVKFDVGSNIVDIGSLEFGRAVNGYGNVENAGAGFAVTPPIYYHNHKSIVSEAIARAAVNGYFVAYFKADGTFISTVRNVSGVIPKIANSDYIIATVDIYYEAYGFNIAYGDLLPYSEQVNYNPLGKYDDNDAIKLFAYADGDATPDSEDSFYGNKGYWKAWHNSGLDKTIYTRTEYIEVGKTITYDMMINHGRKFVITRFKNANSISEDNITFYNRDSSRDLNVGAIQRAIFSCEPERKYVIHCKGHFKFTSPDQFEGNQGSLFAMVWMTNRNVTLQGDGHEKTIIEVDLPDNLGTSFPYFNYSPVEIASGKMKDMSIIGHNCRYAVHSVDAMDVEFERVMMWHKPNTGDAFTAWGSPTTFGIGSIDFSKYTVKDCDLIDSGYPIYIHDNNGVENGYHFLIENTRLISKAVTSDMQIIASLFCLMSNSHGTLELKNVSLGNRRKIIVGEDSSWSRDEIYPDIHARIIGDLNLPIYYDFQSTIGKVLKIKSKSTGVNSKVRIDKTSSAFDKLFNGKDYFATGFEELNGIIHVDNYRCLDGADNLRGWAMGELPIDPSTSGSMQNRLADCSVTPLELIIIVDGNPLTISFNKDYSSFTDTDILAEINNAISAVATAEIYTLGSEYYPELNQIVEILANNSGETILIGMGVKIKSGQITAATSDEEVSGIALDDIKSGFMGRVATKGYFSTTEKRFKVKLDSQASCLAGEKFSISSNPGIFEKKSTGKFTAEYDSLVLIDLGLNLKLDKSSVKLTTGTSETDVMCQKAVTDELAKKQEVVVNYTHTGNKEVNIESIDFATGTITSTGHGLAVSSIVYLINKGMDNFPFSALPNGLNPLTAYGVVNVTPNTFQLTSGGVPITLSDKATKDYSKWHLELPGSASISGLSLRKFTVELEGKSSGNQSVVDYLYLYGGKNYGVAGTVWITDTEYSKITLGLNRSIFKSMANGDIWSYNRLDIDVTGKRASILINGYRIYSLTETTRGIIRHNNEVAVHSSVGEDVVTRFIQQNIFNGMNIKVTKIL